MTDRDIDHFQEVTLRTWLNDSGAKTLLDAMREGRSGCKLRWLTGSAPVMYGFPITIARKTAGSLVKPAGSPVEPNGSHVKPDSLHVRPAGSPAKQLMKPAPTKRGAGKRVK